MEVFTLLNSSLFYSMKNLSTLLDTSVNKAVFTLQNLLLFYWIQFCKVQTFLLWSRVKPSTKWLHKTNFYLVHFSEGRQDNLHPGLNPSHSVKKVYKKIFHLFISSLALYHTTLRFTKHSVWKHKEYCGTRGPWGPVSLQWLELPKLTCSEK